MQKRGVIELQFNWVFVLIVGALILSLFIWFALKQSEISSTKLSKDVLTNLNTIFTGAKVSKGTVYEIKISNINLEFNCNNNCFCTYKIQGYAGEGNQLKGATVFAPNIIKSPDLIAWSLDWNVPYRVSNFLFLTSPKVRYILGTGFDTTFSNTLTETLPRDLITVDTPPDWRDIDDTNNYKIKLLVAPDPNNPDYPKGERFNKDIKKTAEKDITAIKIDGIAEEGTITYYNYDINDGFSAINDYHYVGFPALIAAIFADEDNYKCIMQDAYDRYNYVTKIYKERARQLQSSTSTTCQTYYRDADDDLNEFPNTDPPFGLASTIFDYANNLEETNDNLLLYSCPLIY